MKPQENLGAWINEHYTASDDDPPVFVCKRCSAKVAYVTKHAVARHGDDIDVMPVVPGKEDLLNSY